MTTISVPVQLRHGTADEWAAANPVLLEAEQGYETDTGRRKVGDGVTAWAALPYADGGMRLVPASGDTTGATDAAAINAAIADGDVLLVGGPYYTNAPIIMKSDRTLTGQNAEVRLVAGSNCQVIRNEHIVVRSDPTADSNIGIVGVGGFFLNGQGALQDIVGGGGTYWLNQGVVLCGVTGVRVQGVKINSNKGALHIIGCHTVRGGDIEFDQATGSINQDGLDIGPDCEDVHLSGFTGSTADDSLSFYAKRTAAMIPPNTYQTAGGNVLDVYISDVNVRPVGENCIRLQAADGSVMRRVHFDGVISRTVGAALVRLGPTTYSTTPPAAADFTDITIDGYSCGRTVLELESPCWGISATNGIIRSSSGGPPLIAASQYATDCRSITLDGFDLPRTSGVDALALSTDAAAVLNGVRIRNGHIGRGRLTACAGTVTNLHLRDVTVGVATAALFNDAVAPTGSVDGVTVDSYASGVTACYAGQPLALRMGAVMPIATSADVTPSPATKGSRLVCDNTKQADGGAGTTAAEWVANGTTWIKAVDLGAMAGR